VMQMSRNRDMTSPVYMQLVELTIYCGKIVILCGKMATIGL
jgi:hypothetical protein